MASALFSVNEKVQVPHTDKYYSAKVTKAELRDNVWFYFLHYLGWNKKYDEWVEESGLAKCPQTGGDGAANALPGKKSKSLATSAPGVVSVIANSAGQIGKKRPLVIEATAAAAAAAAAGGLPQPVTAAVAGGTVAAAAGGTAAFLLDLDIPPLLKKALLDDFDAVVEEGKVVPLPRTPNVAEMLQMYVQQAMSDHGSAEAEEEVCHGLRAYFDKSLHVALLYPSERLQESLIMVNGRVASSVYGPEHFLRLLAKLPDVLASAMVQLTEEQMRTIAALVQDVMLWMCERPGLLLTKDQYVVPVVPSLQ